MRLLLVCAGLTVAVGSVSAASFNCADAQTPVEYSICASPELNRLDTLLGDRFSEQQKRLADAERELALIEQRTWLKSREQLCLINESDCLIDLYRKRLKVLSSDRQKLVPFKIAVPQPALRKTSSSCELPGLMLPDNTLVYAAGSYSGRKLDVQIDQSGHQATQFDLLVNVPGRPVALLLGAYEPSIWNIGWTEGTDIQAVLVTGYHRQAVAGLPAQTPIRNSSYEDKGPCGYLYISEKSLAALNPMAQRVFKRNVDMVYKVENGVMVIGEPLAADAVQLTSSDTPPESFIDTSLPKAGPAGLADAVAQGLMRPATAVDLAAWQAIEDEKASKLSQGLPPMANPSQPQPFAVHNGYILLKAQRLPAGLYGAHMATFFLPKGVPYPEGELGHSTLYDFNTGLCRGVSCAR